MDNATSLPAGAAAAP
ncbi:MFS transporter, partial [Pseudomonas sp. TJI-51]